MKGHGIPRVVGTTIALRCRTLCVAACITWTFLAGSAAAEGLRIAGFGTLGYVADNRSDIAPARDISQRPASDFQTGNGWKVDSRIGLQLEYGVTPNLDLVGQWVLRDQFHGNADKATELAYLAYRPRDTIDLRVGRISYDAFLMSDHRNVGYAYTWVRPPLEFYGWIPVFSVDGADVAYRWPGDEGHWRIKLQAGRGRTAIPIQRGYDFAADRLLGVSLLRESSRWRFKAAYSQFTVASEVPAFVPLQAGLDQLAAAAIPLVSAEAADLRRNLSFQNARVGYATLGAAYDDGTWFAQAELGSTTASAAAIPHGRMGYASVGRRFGDWAPYLLRSTSRPGNDVRAAANNWGAFNATLRDPGLFIVNTTRIEQDTWSLGVRWDFQRSAALKLQWDRTTIRPSGYGLWWRDLALNDQRRSIDLLSASVDFAF